MRLPTNKIPKSPGIVLPVVLALLIGSISVGQAARKELTNPPPSEIIQKDLPPITQEDEDQIPFIEPPEKIEFPLPEDDNSVLDNVDNNASGQTNPVEDIANTEPPEILRDFSNLPVPVARMRELIMQAARSGSIKDIGPLIGTGDNTTMLSLGGIEGDPLEFFKSLSGDDEGHEILAILLEVLEAGYVRIDAGTDSEVYVWPYFVVWPPEKLTPPQKVEMFRILTAGDFEDMQSFGGYIFYRVGISPQGQWQFFVAGD